jgi:hypothetical protein
MTPFNMFAGSFLVLAKLSGFACVIAIFSNHRGLAVASMATAATALVVCISLCLWRMYSYDSSNESY